MLCLQTLQRELQGHKSRIEDVLDRAAIVASIRSPEADYVRAAHDQLAQLWGLLWAETERRQLILDAMYQAQQYFFDTAEVEAWLSEQELHMMNEEKGKVCVCVHHIGVLAIVHQYIFIRAVKMNVLITPELVITRYNTFIELNLPTHSMICLTTKS